MMDLIKLSTSDIISLCIWAAAFVAVVMWGHTFRKKKRDLVGNRKYFYMFSGVMILIACIGLFGRGINYGLDFTGGTVLELAAPQQIKVGSSEIANMVKEVDPGLDVTVQMSEKMEPGADGQMMHKFLVRVRDSAESQDEQNNGVQLTPEKSQQVVQKLQERLGVGELTKLSETSIGATVSSELKSGAVIALLIAMLCQLIYITFRFGNQLRFGFAADVALAHDAIIMVGFYALSGMAMDSSFVAALLTLAGYSVMDSIVIFDRIREHMHKDNCGFNELVNNAINETMTRSINTTLTTAVVCVALYFFGGPTLKGFAFALLVGVIAGAYSSIFVAAPLLCECEVLAKKRDANRQEEIRLAAEERARERGERSASRPSKPVKTVKQPRSAKEVANDGVMAPSAEDIEDMRHCDDDAPAESVEHAARPARPSVGRLAVNTRRRTRVKGMHRS